MDSPALPTPAPTPILITDAAALQPFHGCVCIPTMGALHEGHLSLIRQGRHLAAGKPVLVSIFVNPTQFGPAEDYARYPRTLESDLAMCAQAGADAVFAPSVDAIYPGGIDNLPPQPPLPPVATQPGLEDRCRPGHFAGVCRVVRRLYELIQPATALYGEKDYQQLLTLSAQAQDENLGVTVLGQPTVRDPDGLALSSRNIYLSPVQRSRALSLIKSLRAAAELARQRVPMPAVEAEMRSLLLAHQVAVEYAVVRDARTLMPLADWSAGPARALIAGKVGSTRLIDNLALP